MANELRKGTNNINIIGVVKEHKLQLQKNNKKEEYINGSLVIKAGEYTEIELKVFVSKLKKDGTVKKNFETLKKFIDKEYDTVATNKENATTISVYGNGDFCPQLREERYANGTKTEMITKVSCDLGFGNIKIDDYSEEDFKATFDIEMFVTSVDEEMKEDEETGRVIVKGFTPIYGGDVMEVKVFAGKIVDEEGEYDFAEDVRDGVDAGDTVNFWGDINFMKIITKKKKGGGMGRAKIEERTDYINELVAIGAELVEDEEKAFDEELIGKAVKERKVDLEERLEKAKKDNKGEDKSNKKGMSGSKDKSDKPKRNINF